MKPLGEVSLNEGFTYTEIIATRSEGRSLLGYLTERYTHSSREVWEARIADGLVMLDGHPGTAEDLLRRGQQLSWLRPPWEEPEVPMGFAVLYRDAELLAVAKPSGLPTLPAGGYLEHTLLAQVRRHYPEASPVHRLGRGTSGIVLFARTHLAGKRVLEAWREHRVVKIYRALVQGGPAEEAFRVDTPIGPVPHPTLVSVHAASAEGKPSTSHVQVIERRADSSLVEVRIETGRPHQIRIHMATCGHPLVGDPLYAIGGGLREGEALPGDEGYYLHALRLSLPHPRTGILLSMVCQPPPSLRAEWPHSP